MKEHLWIGQLGHIATTLFFVCALLSFYFYSKSISLKDNFSIQFKKVARYLIYVQFGLVLCIFSLIIYIILNHYFEYYYAYQHSSLHLQFQYLLSSIWEGQEGSFLLWIFWNALIACIIIKYNKKSEPYILGILSLIQVWLGSMILGVYLGDVKIGSDPFILLKDVFQDAPIFQTDNYLEFVKDGSGLNVLLQNYWMVIHPPVLFLGFALCAVPFCYVVASLLYKDFPIQLWSKEVMKWSLGATIFLGVGIMMGAAWAYESLTFGGYWAWDPVENASLVPWLILIGGFHANAIFNHTQKAKRLVFFLYGLTFLFVLYSTFLTRSGVLGNASVHAFTDLGMNVQLLSYVLFFFFIWIIPYVLRYKSLSSPTLDKEENIMTREFFLLLGASVLIIAAFIIIIKTSLPVINLVFGTQYAQPENVIYSYNKSLIFLVILITFLSSFSLFLSYKKTLKHLWMRKLILLTSVSILCFLPLLIWGDMYYDKYGVVFGVLIYILLYTSCFALIASVWIVFVKKIKQFLKMGTAFSHFGFALMILGILYSSVQKNILSYNTVGFSPHKINDIESPLENITLVKGARTDIHSYWVTYSKKYYDSIENKYFFDIHFESKTGEEKFVLKPDVIKNNKGQEGFTPNPDVKHYWNKDFYTYITYLQDNENSIDKVKYKNVSMKIGDTHFFSKGYFILNTIYTSKQNAMLRKLKLDTALQAILHIHTLEGQHYLSKPMLYVKNNQIVKKEDTVFALDLVFSLDKLIDNHTFELSYIDKTPPLEFITLKIYSFSHITLVWLGGIIMFLGMFMSILKRRGLK